MVPGVAAPQDFLKVPLECDSRKWYLEILLEDRFWTSRHTVLGRALIFWQEGTWRIWWAWFFQDLVLFSIWHTTLPISLSPYAKVLLQIVNFYSQPIGQCNQRTWISSFVCGEDLVSHWRTLEKVVDSGQNPVETLRWGWFCQIGNHSRWLE